MLSTPYQRLLEDARVTEDVKARLRTMASGLDPVRLLRDIRAVQQRLVEIADRTGVGEHAAPTQPTLEEFLKGLRTAWREGEVRPTAQPKPKATRERCRPDPLAKVTAQLHARFCASPWLTTRKLLAHLQAEMPDSYPETLLRTLQRRLKQRRGDAARQLVFGAASEVTAGSGGEATGMPNAATDVADEAAGMAG